MNLTAVEYFSLLFWFIASACLVTSLEAIRQLSKQQVESLLTQKRFFFLYQILHNLLSKRQLAESLVVALMLCCFVLRFLYALQIGIFLHQETADQNPIWIGFIGWLIFFIAGEIFPKRFAQNYPLKALNYTRSFSSLLLFLFFPFLYPFHLLYFRLGSTSQQEQELPERFWHLMNKEELSSLLEPYEQRLLQAVITFRDTIVREIMVPRGEIFALPAEISLYKARKLAQQKGYTRIPLYHKNMDHIIGVVLYKDLFQLSHPQTEQELEEIELKELLKPLLHIPETKKLASLLQELRQRQSLLAIAVDEYGSTSGLITIEDILEQIVGEIADEHDEEPLLFQAIDDSSWAIAGKMKIDDLTRELAVIIPEEGDYDTIGGFVTHCAGVIPPKGFIVERDSFTIEVIVAHERRVEKVRLRKR